MFAAVRAKIDRFNAAHPWSHNDHYHRWVLRQLPDPVSRSMDVGCGTGNLVRVLSARSDIPVGIDIDPAVVEIARHRSAAQPNVTFEVLDLLDVPEGARYDAVTALTVVHHLALAAALAQMRSILAPGGTIVIVGCYRAVTWFDHLIGVVAIPANMGLGLLKSAGAEEARVAMSAPTVPAHTSLADVKEIAADVLPGARIRRRLFWRYSLTYKAPPG